MLPDPIFVVGWDLSKKLDFEENLQVIKESLQFLQFEVNFND